MARPRKAVPSISKEISLPINLVTRVDLLLFSPIEGKVPFGAWQKYLVTLIEADLARREKLK